MKAPKDGKDLIIDEIKGLVTNADPTNLSESYATEMIGLKNTTPGFLADKDFGTKRMYSSYPSNFAINNGEILTDIDTGTEHAVLWGYDSVRSRWRLFVDLDGTGNWYDVTRKLTTTINTVGSTTSVTMNTLYEDGVTAVTPPTMNSWIIWNVTRSTGAFIVSNASLVLTTSQFSSTWISGDVIWIFNGEATLYAFLENSNAFSQTLLGTTPYSRFHSIQPEKKINFYYGSSAKPAIMFNSISVFKITTAYDILPDSGNFGQFTIASGFRAQRGGGGLMPTFQQLGYLGGELLSNDSVQYFNTTLPITTANDSMMVITLKLEHGVSNNDFHLVYVAMTATFNGYEETDPIYRVFTGDMRGGHCAFDTFFPAVDMALLPKNLTALNFYQHNVTNADIDSGARVLANVDKNYLFRFSIPILVDAQNPGTTTMYWGALYSAAGQYVGSPPNAIETTQANGISLATALNRTTITGVDPNTGLPTTTRKYYTPRFAVNSSRSENPVVVIDINNRTLLACIMDGYGVLEDDNFSEITIDNNSNQLTIDLLTDGNLIGLQTDSKGLVYAFKDNGFVEIIDIQSGEHEIRTMDVDAPNSIISCEYGIIGAGSSGINFIPNGGGQIQRISLDINNLYDGTLRSIATTLVPTTVPLISTANRLLACSGYIRKTKELIIQIPTVWPISGNNSAVYMNYLFQFDGNKWRQRIFNNADSGKVLFFMTNKTGYLVIGFPSTIQYYPNMTDQNVQFEDDVTSAGASTNHPVTCTFTIEIGSLFGLSVQSILYRVFAWYDRVIDTGSTATMTLTLCANHGSTNFQTITFPLNGKSIPHNIVRRGQINRLTITMNLSTDITLRSFTLSQLVLSYVLRARKGTR